MNAGDILQQRLQPVGSGVMHVRSKLRHFALINYAIPGERLARYIPQDRFTIPEFHTQEGPRALMSAVPFIDIDFHFIHLFPFLQFTFGQTNYRVYVIDRQTGEHCVWFFGTTLGSPLVHIPRVLWRIPWHRARYAWQCDYDNVGQRYDTFRYSVSSQWAESEIDIQDMGTPVGLQDGFSSMDEQTLILTHPVTGFFHRLDHRLGLYSVWHDTLNCTIGQPRNLYFGLFQRLGLLSRQEMARPHSVFLCPETDFTVLLPPHRL